MDQFNKTVGSIIIRLGKVSRTMNSDGLAKIIRVKFSAEVFSSGRCLGRLAGLSCQCPRRLSAFSVKDELSVDGIKEEGRKKRN